MRKTEKIVNHDLCDAIAMTTGRTHHLRARNYQQRREEQGAEKLENCCSHSGHSPLEKVFCFRAIQSAESADSNFSAQTTSQLSKSRSNRRQSNLLDHRCWAALNSSAAAGVAAVAMSAA